ncbi:hypothetical protein CK203_093098 [Vitis vinifera]|uniref:Uncharacterized protein n=1 Tax=Vitis vinifera TaxID=29760 RepID=A0A438FC52_VITVI|nr:hypothetical protein CK203_093098 [Vitis vinifera]
MLHSRCHTGAYSPSLIEIYRSPLVYMIIHGYGIRVRSMFDFILSGYSEEPLLSHSARFILFYIVTIPGWSCLWCLDFPRHHLRGVHIRSVTRPIGVILGSSRQIGASFETCRVPFSHFQRIEICSGMPHWESPSSLFSFGVQSHHRFSDRHSESHPKFWRSEPSSLLSFGVQSHHRAITIFSFGVQSHHRFLVWRSEPSSLFSFGVQSHHYFQFWRSEPSLFSAHRAITVILLRLPELLPSSSLFNFGVQSHHRFSVLAFKAIITSQSAFRAIDISSLGVWSHHHHSSIAIIAFQFWRSEPSLFLFLAFRAIIAFQFWRSKPPSSIFSFGVQSHHRFSVLAFRAIIEPSSLFSLAFRAIIAFQFWRSEPSLFSVLAFRAITIFGLESALSSKVTTPGVHIHWLGVSCLHGFILSLGFSSLRYPVLIAYSSRSPHRVVPFGRILARTPGWFDRYSSLTLISWVTFRDILEGVWVLDAALEVP